MKAYITLNCQSTQKSTPLSPQPQLFLLDPITKTFKLSNSAQLQPLYTLDPSLTCELALLLGMAPLLFHGLCVFLQFFEEEAKRRKHLVQADCSVILAEWLL